MVGGAACLEIAPGMTALASGYLPKEWVAEATSHWKSLELLEGRELPGVVAIPTA